MALIDLDAVLEKLNTELAHYKEKVRETEVTIRRITELGQVVERTNIGIPTQGGSRSLSDAIVSLLENRKVWMSTTEIASAMEDQGLAIRSKSKNFRLLVITTVPKLYNRKKRRIERIDGPGGIKYGALGLIPDAGKGGLMFEKKD